jgi:hypothetical protein
MYQMKKEIELDNLESKDKAVIITHGDIDGMVCGAQLIRLEKSNCNLVFSNARYVNSALYQILKSNKISNRLYIADIPANPKTESILAVLVKNNVEVIWIDHHPWPDDLKARIEELGISLVYNEGMDTPAGILIGRWLKEKDSYCYQIGKICYAYNKGTDWERNWFKLLASYTAKSDREVLERLAYNKDLTEDDLHRIEQQEQRDQLAEEILRKAPYSVKTRSGKEMVIYDTSKLDRIYLGHRVFNYHSVDFCLIRISERKWQFASNPSLRHSMKSLLGTQNIDGLSFSIAGRENELLAIVWKREAGHPNPHEYLIKWLCDKV